MDRVAARKNDRKIEQDLENEPVLQLRLILIKMKADALLEELRTFEVFTASKRELNLAVGINFYDEIRRFETDLIINALKYTQGHQGKAARILNVKLTTLNSKIRHYQIPLKETESFAKESSSRPDKSRHRMDAKGEMPLKEETAAKQVVMVA